MKNRIIEKDLVLLNSVGLKEDKISLTNEDINLVIKCFDKNYYSTNYKIKDTYYCPFIGIEDLGSILFQELLWIIPIHTFEETTRLIALMHGSNSLDANLGWLISDVNNPSISECVCFKDELSRLDMSNVNHRGFVNDIVYLPQRDWIERHTKIIFALAIIFLKDPIRYYKAFYSLNKEAFKKVLKMIKKDEDFILKNRNIDIEKAYASILDLQDRGMKHEEVFSDEQTKHIIKIKRRR